MHTNRNKLHTLKCLNGSLKEGNNLGQDKIVKKVFLEQF